jgi:hypothetical protein
MHVPMFALTHPPAIHVLAILVIVWQVIDVVAMVSELLLYILIFGKLL